jgi:hypothetical protein
MWIEPSGTLLIQNSKTINPFKIWFNSLGEDIYTQKTGVVEISGNRVGP